MGDCEKDFPQFVSPMAAFANELLNGDHKQPKNDRFYGLLLRTADYFILENITEVLIRHNNAPVLPLPPMKNTPASYLHASMRASGAIYQNVMDKEQSQGDYTLLFGTKFKQNTALKAFQKGKETLDCDYVYVHDAGTVDRGTVYDKNNCNDRARESAICVEDECLANGPGSCGGCKISAKDFGDLVGRWAETTETKLAEFFSPSCFYETIDEAVIASNSLWSNRQRWFMDADVQDDYQGYNECATSLNIDDPGMADALVLTLHRTDSQTPISVCYFPNHVWLNDRLKLAYEHGHGDQPVIFYRESYGIHQINDCVTLFESRDCHDAWQKEFFSQEYAFGDEGPCLHKPPGCDEVYYFPSDGDKCSAYTDVGKERIRKLCRDEKKLDARLAYDQLMKPSSSFGRVGGRKNAKADLSSAVLVEEPTSSDWLGHISLFMAGVLLSLFVRRKMVISVGR